MTSPDSVKLQVRYRYLLFRKNGAVLPLIAVEDLPSSFTVFPPPDMMDGITLVQEITKLSGEDSSPGMRLLSGGGQLPLNGGHDEGYEYEDDKNDRIGTTPSGPPHTCLSPPTKMHTCAVVGPPPFQVDQQQVVQGIDHSYLHPNHSPARLQKGDPVSPSPLLQALTARESRLKASGLFKKDICQSFLRDSVCKWGDECTFRHETPLRPEKWLKSARGRALDGTGPSEDAVCGQEPDRGTSDDGQCPSGDDSDDDDDGEEDDCEVGNESGTTAATTTDGEPCGTNSKSKKPEPCAYFRRRVGCKRGKECFYLHEDESGSLAVDENVCSKKEGGGSSTNSSASNAKKMEGGWRRTVESPAGDKGEESKKLPFPAKVAEASKRKGIACSTPGRVPSTADPLKHVKTHCTFFLRFGECDYWPSCKFSHERPEGLLTLPPSLSPIPAAGFTRWRTNRIPSGPADKKSGASVKKILSRDNRVEGITKPPPSGMAGLSTGGRFSLLDKSSGHAGLQEPIGTTTGTGENKSAIAEGQLIMLAD